MMVYDDDGRCYPVLDGELKPWRHYELMIRDERRRRAVLAIKAQPFFYPNGSYWHTEASMQWTTDEMMRLAGMDAPPLGINCIKAAVL